MYINIYKNKYYFNKSARENSRLTIFSDITKSLVNMFYSTISKINNSFCLNLR